MKKVRLSVICVSTALLVGCANDPVYHADDFVSPNKVVTQEVDKPVLPEVKASFGVGNDPVVVKAYEEYKNTGKLVTVNGDGWVSYPYTNNSKPIIACSMLHFCIVQLEAGEKLNSIGLGDTESWKTNAFMTGEGASASVSIQTKPIRNGVSTDMTISTNKRTYLIGLVAKGGSTTTVLRFYYPEETMLENVKKMQVQQASSANNQVVSTLGPQVDLSHVSFNYEIKGDSPAWRPLRVFDDGEKTYIEMPKLASKVNLPVLYLARSKQMQMVNYRYNDPYFVVDGLFSRAWLVSGKGSEQERVELLNGNIQN